MRKLTVMVMVMNMTERFSKLFKKGKAKKNRKGRKCQRKENFVDDLVNLIVENEKYRQKLLLTNVKNAKNGQYMESAVKEIQERCTECSKKFPYSINQTQQKFCRCVRHVGSCP